MSDKIFYPYCKECNSLLYFEIEPLNFSINYICSKNKDHYKKKVYFKTFERFYLKKQNLIKCSKCYINLENSDYYNCEECANFYCSKCMIEDIQINRHKSISNKKYSNRCLIHQNDFTKYCVDCKKNLCIFCIRNDEFHKNHKIIRLYEIMPSSKDIKNLQEKIKEKSNYTNNLIEKLENLKRQINSKIEELLQNLKDEISLLKKIVLNFNNTFMNFTYFQIFNYINKNIDNKHNNKMLIEFYNTEDIKKQIEILFEVFKYLGKKIKKNQNEKKENKESEKNYIVNNTNLRFVSKWSDKLFLNYDGNKLMFSYYDENKREIYNKIQLI